VAVQAPTSREVAALAQAPAHYGVGVVGAARGQLATGPRERGAPLKGRDSQTQRQPVRDVDGHIGMWTQALPQTTRACYPPPCASLCCFGHLFV
jgi:hypothetical protein